MQNFKVLGDPSVKLYCNFFLSQSLYVADLKSLSTPTSEDLSL